MIGGNREETETTEERGGMTGIERRKAATREVWTLAVVWLGLGEVDPAAGPPVRRGVAFMAVQSAVVVALVAAVALVKPAVFGGDVRGGWPFGLLLLILPVAAGIARRPAGLPVALAAAIPAGALAGGLAWVALTAVLSGFWLWFVVLSLACLAAGPVFGALAPDDVADPDTEPITRVR
jgi:hypothetical protein